MHDGRLGNFGDVGLWIRASGMTYRTPGCGLGGNLPFDNLAFLSSESHAIVAEAAKLRPQHRKALSE